MAKGTLMAEGTGYSRGKDDSRPSGSVAPTQNRSAPNGRVLIIDDDRGLSRLIALVLRGAGFEADIANSGDDGLRLLNGDHYDVVMLDLRMPGKDGREVFREMRDGGNRTPVMILSAYDAHRAHEDLGAEGYMNKPFEPDNLVSELNEMLGNIP
jgi:DNA-binding response OmpR family regulator